MYIRRSKLGTWCIVFISFFTTKDIRHCLECWNFSNVCPMTGKILGLLGPWVEKKGSASSAPFSLNLSNLFNGIC